MSRQVLVLQCGSDTKKKQLSTVFTHLKLALRGARRPTTLCAIDVEASDFKLDQSLIQQWISLKPILVLMVTPSLVANDEMTGDNMKALVRVASDNGIAIVPVYCIKVPNPDRTPWIDFAWMPWAKHGDNQPLATRNLDSHCCEIAEGIVRVVEKEPKAVASRHVTVPQGSSDRGTAATTAPATSKRAASDYKVPPLAVFTCATDEQAVRDGLEPVLTLLARERNVRSYTRWSVPTGSEWERHEMLAAKAPVALILLSSSALADDRVFDVIKRLTPEQDVIFVLLSPCLWEILSIDHLKHSVLPVATSEPAPIVGFSKGKQAAWQQIASALLGRFKERLADEDPHTLSTAEQDIETEFERRRRAAEASRRRPDPDFDIVKAYWQK